MWLEATRVRTAPGSTVSRITASPGGHRGERAGRGDAQRRHRLADHVLAQDRAERGPPVAAARVGRPTRAFELYIASRPGSVDDLAEEDRAPVPELRHERAELVPRVRGGNRLGRLGDAIARQHLHAFLAGEQVGIEAESGGQGPVNPNEPRGPDRGGRDAREEPLGQPRIRVVERKTHCHQEFRSILSPGPRLVTK